MPTHAATDPMGHAVLRSRRLNRPVAAAAHDEIGDEHGHDHERPGDRINHHKGVPGARKREHPGHERHAQHTGTEDGDDRRQGGPAHAPHAPAGTS